MGKQLELFRLTVLNDINYGGDIALKDFGLKVNFNGVDYTFADATVLLQNGNILVTEPVKIRDGRNNSSGNAFIGAD